MSLRHTGALARFECAVLLRNPEQLLLTLVIPVVLLVLLTRTGLPALATSGATPAAAERGLLAGVIALALFSSAFTAQAIATGFERRSGMLRLLATTPATTLDMVAGKAVATLAVQSLQCLLLLGCATALGVLPPEGWRLLPILLLLAGLMTWATGTWGLALAGSLRAEAVLAVANGIWLAAAVLGGLIVPVWALGPAGAVLAWLPTAAVAGLLRTAVGAEDPGGIVGGLAVLTALGWGAAGAVLARSRGTWH